MSAEELVRAHLVITGHVQGVYFRAETARHARAEGLAGWVRNVGDEVETVFEGPRGAVERLIAWCHEGPSRASVTDMAVTWEEPSGEVGFRVR